MERSPSPVPVLWNWLLSGALGLMCFHGSALGWNQPTIVTLVPTPQWQVTSSRPADDKALAQWGADPAIEKEYGVRALVARTYRFENHTADVLVEQALDPSAAYGLWTFYRGEGMTPVAGMPLTLASPRKALLVRGQALIRVSRSETSALTEAEYRALLKLVAGSMPGSRFLEQLPSALPARGLVPGSGKYLLGPLAAARVLPSFPANLYGFDQGAEVQTAQYSLGSSGKLTLAAINYPTPQIARAALDSISKALDRRSDFSAFDYRRQDNYVLVVINAGSRAAADQFLDQFKVSKLISQDQDPGPSERTQVVQLVQLLLANGILIMGLLVFSLVGGILVFAAKRLARKWFSDSLWVEGSQGGLIMLKLR